MPEIMLIEQVFPAVVAEKSTLHDRLFAEGKARGLSDEDVKVIISGVPKTLIEAGVFLDKMTSLWRYEFGVPYDIAESLIWGTHMWVPVEILFTVLFCAQAHIPEDKRVAYLAQLATPKKHQDKLAEMIPADKVGFTAEMEFEVSGQGVGNRTVDWIIRPQDSRTVLLDVKRRTTDFIKQAERVDAENAAPEPGHDPALLFRSVEQKFLFAQPGSQLQGVWIVTDIKQEENLLIRAFTALNASKVHFAILGDWKPDIYVLARRADDRQYLFNLFRADSSTRFTFRGSNEG